MDIPTKEITVEGEKITIREWLTQEQEDAYNKLLLGDQSFDVNSMNNDSFPIMVDPSRLSEARKYLVESLCVDLKWEEYNLKSPKFRTSLFNELSAIQNPKKK